MRTRSILPTICVDTDQPTATSLCARRGFTTNTRGAKSNRVSAARSHLGLTVAKPLTLFGTNWMRAELRSCDPNSYPDFASRGGSALLPSAPHHRSSIGQTPAERELGTTPCAGPATYHGARPRKSHRGRRKNKSGSYMQGHLDDALSRLRGLMPS